MSKYFDWPASLKRFVRFDAARAEDLNAALDELTAGTDTIEADINRAIKLPVGSSDQLLNLSPGQRANLLIAFDANGDVSVVAGGGRWRGDWATGTAYVTADYFRDTATRNVYSVASAHTSSVLADDIAAGRVQLAINVADVEAEKNAAKAQAEESARQAVISTQQADISAQQALAARDQADAARSIANFVGDWSSLTGPLNKPATVRHKGSVYALLNNLADVTASEPGVTADWADSGAIKVFDYESRGAMRGLAGAFALVDGLGFFQHIDGSDEPDDDETCFATASGRWVLQAPHWDVIYALMAAEISAQDVLIDSHTVSIADFNTRWPGRVLHGIASSAITSIAAGAQSSFTGTVVGAAVGDKVLVTPHNALAAQVSLYALVSAADTVTVYLNNPSATAATLTAGTFKLTVFKET